MANSRRFVSFILAKKGYLFSMISSISLTATNFSTLIGNEIKWEYKCII
jgi:hypothetical protein